jgi:stearoyl-CoA desaturase (delta-9 desaturase)
MLLPDWAVLNAAIEWLANGLGICPGGRIVLYTLVTTHITIAGVTDLPAPRQAHRAMDLHAIPSHFFRFWLWLSTGMVTKEWVAIHRKHHAKCETRRTRTARRRAASRPCSGRRRSCIAPRRRTRKPWPSSGHGTPNDWIERNLYTRYSWQGVGLMLIINLALFGAVGARCGPVQMLWIPVNAAGVINGIGHYWGYRNFRRRRTPAPNISPWGHHDRRRGTAQQPPHVPDLGQVLGASRTSSTSAGSTSA